MMLFNKRSIVSVLSVLFIASSCFAQPVNAEQFSDSTEGKWVEGAFVEYTVKGTAPENRSIGTISGSLSFHVMQDAVTVHLLIDELYGERFERSISFDLIDGVTYYGGEEIILPFFYSDNSTLSKYMNDIESVTSVSTSIGNVRGGITNGQPETNLVVQVSYTDGGERKESRSYYTYGTNTNMLFDANIPSYSVLLNGCFEVAGEVTFKPQITLELNNTNMDLGPVNMAAMLYAYIVMAMPLILIVIAIALFAYLYSRANRKEGKNGRNNRGKRTNKKIR